MTDLDLLLLGCTVTFIAISGSYVFLRERFLERERARRKARVPVRVTDQRRRAA